MNHSTTTCRRHRHRRAAAAALAFAAFAIGLPDSALADRSWNPAVANGSWSTASNWLGGVLPVSTDNVYIDFNNSTGHTITYDAAFSSDLGLRVRNLGTGSATLRFAANRSLQVGSVEIGAAGRGMIDQSTGLQLSTDGELLLASGATGTGTYLLAGNSLLLVQGREYIGHSGIGVFNQSGGYHTVGTAGGEANQLHIAETVGSRGTYLLSGTSTLNVSGHGFVGMAGMGTFNQSGGTHNVGTSTLARNLSLARFVEGAGTYLLSGGTLNVSGSEWLGEYAAGLFYQSGGTHRIGTSGASTSQLNIGRFAGARGTYLLRGGTLSVDGDEYVGSEGIGTILQTAGRNDLGYGHSLVLGGTSTGAGTYGLGGGTVAVQGATLIGTSSGGGGTFLQTGGSHSNFYLNLTRGLYQLDGATASLTSNYYQTIGGSAGARFEQLAGTNTTHDYLTIAPTSGTTGMYNMIGGTLSVTGLGHDGVVYVGQSGNGSFVQHGGVHAITTYGTMSMALGSGTGGVGRYYMQGGTLTTNSDVVIGALGQGTFTHTAGSVGIGSGAGSADLYVGVSGGSADTYLLSGSGVLSVSGDEIVGLMGVAAFDQSGGTHTVGGTLYFGHEDPMGLPGGSGSYALSGNSVLRVTGDEVIGRQGDGSFTQSGGTHTIGGNLYFGQVTNPYANAGQYALGGTGVLSVSGSEYIGYADGGINTFDHSSGTHTVGTNLYVGYGGLGIGGRYTLSDTGALNVSGSEYIGYSGGGSFLHNGGRNDIGYGHSLVLGATSSGFGNYALNGGTLSVQGPTLIGTLGVGTFVQTGGTHNNFYLSLIRGSYALGGATARLNSDYYQTIGGPSGARFDQTGGTNTTHDYLAIASAAGSVGTYTLSGGTLNVTGLGHDGVVYVGQGGTGTFIQSGGLHAITTYGTTSLVVGSGQYLMQGGSLTTTAAVVTLGTFSHSAGTVNVGTAATNGDLQVDGTYRLSGSGVLNVAGAVGVSGLFDQSAGTHTAQAGLRVSDTAEFRLRGGALSVGGDEHVNGYPATFDQSGGTHTVGTFSAARNLYLGNAGMGTGVFRLSGDSTLTVSGSEYMAWGGLTARAADFEQSGGYHRIGGALVVAGTTGSMGGMADFELSGGTLSVGGNVAISQGGRGSFTQSGNSVLQVGGGVGIGGTVDAPGGSGVMNIAGGTATVAGPFRVYGSGLVNYNAGALSVGTLDITSGGHLLTAPGSDVVLRTNALTIAATGVLDLADDHMILDYTGAHAPPLELVRSYVAAGYHGGAWDGDRILSCEGDATTYGLGYAGSWSIFTSFPANFEGYSVDDTAVLVSFTRYGDANLDGQVNLQDFNRLAANFGQTGRFWMQGDFNYDGVVNLQDFNRLATNFGLSAGPDGPSAEDWAALAAVVPEPAGAVFATLAAVAMLSRRRRT